MSCHIVCKITGKVSEKKERKRQKIIEIAFDVYIVTNSCHVQMHKIKYKFKNKKKSKGRKSWSGVGRQHRGMDRLGVRQVPEGSGEQGKVEGTGC